MAKKKGVAPRLAGALAIILGTEEIPLRLRAWDGSEAGPANAPVIEFRSRRGLRRMLWSPNQLGLSRAYVAGDIDGPGDLFESFSVLSSVGKFDELPEALRALPATLFTGAPELMGAPLMDAQELEVYVQAFERTGFTGPLNWYRNLRRNWLDTAGTTDHVGVPALMVSAADDYLLPPDTTRGMERIVPDLERRVIPGCGHWTQQEQPEVMNTLLLDWLQRRMQPRWEALRAEPAP